MVHRVSSFPLLRVFLHAPLFYTHRHSYNEQHSHIRQWKYSFVACCFK